METATEPDRVMKKRPKYLGVFLLLFVLISVVATLLFLHSSPVSSPSLGDTEEQCLKRFGAGEVKSLDAASKTKVVRYSHWFTDDIEVEFVKGVAAEIRVYGDSFTEKTLAEYLDENAQGQKWIISSQSGDGLGYKTFRFYKRNDDATAEWANYLGAKLTIDSPTFLCPPEQTLVDWMKGQNFVVQKNPWIDDTWTIDPSQVSGFVVTGLQHNNDGTYAAIVSFRATSDGKGIECEGAIVYQTYAVNRSLTGVRERFVSFSPTKISKIGSW